MRIADPAPSGGDVLSARLQLFGRIFLGPAQNRQTAVSCPACAGGLANPAAA